MIEHTHGSAPTLINKKQNAASTAPDPASNATTRKRKREDTVGTDGPFKAELFRLKPHPPSAYDKPVTFAHLLRISRACLPLSFLDPSGPPFSSNRLFSSQQDVFEDPSAAIGSHTAAQVLIARHESTQALFAIERVRDNVYAICRLASWVSSDNLSGLVVNASPISLPNGYKPQDKKPANTAWWQSAAIQPIDSMKETKFDRDGPQLLMARPKPDISQQQEQAPAPATEIIDVGSIPQNGESTTPAQALTSDKALENFVIQYLDALYLSRTPLAFFAKGPISRIRALFTSGETDAMQPHHLVASFRSMLLTLSSMDKKYKTKLPDILEDIHLDNVSDEEGTVNLVAKLMRREKSKKPMKLNREGMYHREDQIVKRWWRHGNAEAHLNSPNETLDAAIRRRIAELRFRETLAQVILILEILALEASPTYKPPSASETPISGAGKQGQAQTECQIETGMNKTTTKKAKKPQDLKLLVDLLLDKLCIWQSVEQENVDFKPEALSDANVAKMSNTDRLKDFCIEVIVPFYMSRIPDQAALINRKLGGPKAISPPKKPTTSSKPFKKPGQPETRRAPAPQKNSRRSLGRVASDFIPKSAPRPPSLARSVTDLTPIPNLKREKSETPLAAMPYHRSDSVTSRASASFSTYQRFASREIDLTAMSAATAAKRKRKEAIEEELKAAITTLKKPNRSQAVKELADEADLRKRPGYPMSRTLQSVQVTATPKHGRFTKRVEHSERGREKQQTFQQSPSASFIPSSTIRPPPSNFVPGTVTTNRTVDTLQLPKSNAIEETPSRGPAKTANPFKPSAATIEETPSRGPAKLIDFFAEKKQEMQIIETPMRAPQSKAPAKNLQALADAGDLPIKRSLFADAGSRRESHIETRKSTSMNADRGDGSAAHAKTSQGLPAIFATPQKAQRPAPETPIARPSPPSLPSSKPMEATKMKTPALNGKHKAAENENIYDALGWNDDEDDLAYI